jgi:hypothetical protein
MPHAHLTADKTELFPDPEYSQRARSMLFMGAATLAAAVAEVDEVLINENGVMAVHAPLTPARVGSLSTKTAYPPIVDRMAHVASAVLGRTIRIHNILVDQTKPDVVETAVRLGGGADLRHTGSCWIWWQNRRHCGVCIPCLQRRISFETHGVPDEPMAADPFSDARAIEAPFAKDNLVHLCTSVQHLQEADDVTLELDFPELLDGGTHLSPEGARALYRRWAEQALAVLHTYPLPATILR